MSTGKRAPESMPVQPDLDLFGAGAQGAGEPPAPSRKGSKLPGEGAAPADQALVRVPGAEATLSKAQREFNRAIETIERLRADLARWHAAALAADQRRVAELLPVLERLGALQREVALWIDGYLQRGAAEERLPKKLRTKLVYMLLVLSRAVLGRGPDAEVEAAHDRHAAQTHREDQLEQMDMAAAMLGQAVGDHSLFEGKAASVEELMARAAQRMAERAEAGDGPANREAEAEATPGADHPSGRTHRPNRAERERVRDAQALKEASQGVRELYRRLASQLHPDRAPDEAERAQRTAQMACVNEAYGRNDLLALLSVQIEIEQIDAGHLQGVSEQRLRQYVRVLKEQVQALELELNEQKLALHELRFEHRALHRGNVVPGLYQRVLDAELNQVREVLRGLQHDAGLLRDGRTRLGYLKVLQIDDPDDLIDDREEAMLQGLLDEALGGAEPPPAGRRRGGRR